MPYNRTAELPAAVKKQYKGKALSAFRKAFNDALRQGKSEEQAFKIGHAAARRAGTEKAESVFDIRERVREHYGREPARDVPSGERKKLADKGAAMPDGSFPIANESDLRNAIKAYGRAKNKDAVKRHIIKRAKALGKTNMLPDDWRESSAADASTPVQTSVDAVRAFVTEAKGKTLLTGPASPEQANEHFLWLRGAFVGADEANRNGALWTSGDLQLGEPSVKHGPLNWLHTARHVVGALTESRFVTPGEIAAGKQLLQPHKQPLQPHIEATAALWRWVYPAEAQVVEHAAERGSLWFSMECVSRAVACVDHGCGEWPYMQAALGGDGVCEHIIQRSGTRRYVDPTFLGGAVIVPPVKPGWIDARVDLLRSAADYAEAAYDQAGRPDMPAGDWERIVASVYAYAEL